MENDGYDDCELISFGATRQHSRGSLPSLSTCGSGRPTPVVMPVSRQQIADKLASRPDSVILLDARAKKEVNARG
jgi:hypothetical protein